MFNISLGEGIWVGETEALEDIKKGSFIISCSNLPKVTQDNWLKKKLQVERYLNRLKKFYMWIKTKSFGDSECKELMFVENKICSKY